MTLREILAPPDTEADDPGVEGNSRLTATTGIVLTVLLLIEGFTILDVRGYITLHTCIGLLLIGPITLKTVTTMYRFGRYYTGKPAYVRRGPPMLLLRLIGPLVVAGSVVVLGTGVALLIEKGNSDFWLNLHQVSFVVWIILVGVHFLGHIWEAVRGTARELRPSSGTRGRTVRMLALVASLAVGLAIAGAFTPDASSWQLHRGDHGRFHDGGAPRP